MERGEGNERLRAGVASRPSAQDIVPVVERRRLELDGGIKAHHGLSHGLAGGIEIEAAPEAAALLKESRHPSGVGPGAGGGQTAVLWVEHVTTDGIDGRFAEDDVGSREGGNGEEALVLLGTRGHAAPGNRTATAQFGPDGLAGGVAEQEDNIGPGVGIKVAGVGQGLNQRLGQGALLDQVALDGVPLVWRRLGQTQGRGRQGRERGDPGG